MMALTRDRNGGDEKQLMYTYSLKIKPKRFT